MNKLITQNISKTYKSFDNDFKVIKDLSISFNQGSNSILGKSGCGKTSLLYMLGGLIEPTSGSILFNSQNLTNFSENDWSGFRRRNLGYIFQFHNLLPEFTALENVYLPLLIDNVSLQDAKERAMDILDKVSLAHRADHKPAMLSGGERQRVSVCRALINNPKIILADEPTGSLDSKNAENLINIIYDFAEKQNAILILVSHNNEIAKLSDKCFYMTEGGELNEE